MFLSIDDNKLDRFLLLKLLNIWYDVVTVLINRGMSFVDSVV